jgi:hypothetical protein
MVFCCSILELIWYVCVLLYEELECMQNMIVFICVPKPECSVQLCFMVNLNVVQVENLSIFVFQNLRT